MRLLIIDTSTERSGLALCEKGILISKRIFPFGYQSSKHLFSAIQHLLEESQWDIDSLQALAVSSGPGSFTGIRVGIAAAKGLAFAKKLPLLGFSSLEGFISEEHTSFISLIDAKMGDVYVFFQRWEQGKLVREFSPQRLTLEEFKQKAKGSQCIISPNSEQIQKKCQECTDWTWLESPPDFAYLAQLTYQKYFNNEFTQDQSLLIFY